MNISDLRRRYHEKISAQIIRISRRAGKEDFPNFADGDSAVSRQLAWGIVDRIGCGKNFSDIKGQTVGKRFEVITKEFLEESFSLFSHVRPGDWIYACEQTAISQFEQYAHLAYIEKVFQGDPSLESAKELNNEESLEILNMMVQGRRLRDISDLPFDLAI